ncbi:MAG: 16S rRNA (cytidine(1402)-2'-O)-methyltransferase [Anaerofustis stercorihominis]|nr:16S rRNA (cytidine(1402)-2'-O)-methyltransferase [Anaerofustis stercorihominis]
MVKFLSYIKLYGRKIVHNSGNLFIVATPIGNLKDITLRALEVLKEVDFILCEDTRHSAVLLNYYEIKKPLYSYHKFNEAKSCEFIISKLLDGQNAALISDAGTPLISDPGNILVKELIENNIDFYVIPGASAILSSVIMSGFDTDRFFFNGFLPKKRNKRKEILTQNGKYPFMSVYYVSPHELTDVLEDVNDLLPDRALSLSKELTKLHEQTLRGSAREIMDMLPEDIKGEYVLIIDGGSEETPSLSDEDIKAQFNELSKQMKANDALKLLSAQTGIPKRELYDRFMKK